MIWRRVFFGVFGVGLVNSYKLFYGIKDGTFLHNRISSCHSRDVILGTLDIQGINVYGNLASSTLAETVSAQVASYIVSVI